MGCISIGGWIGAEMSKLTRLRSIGSGDVFAGVWGAD